MPRGLVGEVFLVRSLATTRKVSRRDRALHSIKVLCVVSFLTDLLRRQDGVIIWHTSGFLMVLVRRDRQQL